LNVADTVGPWVAIIALLVAIANTVWVWLSQPGRVAKQRHETVLENLKQHDRRIQALESDQKHLPTKDDLHELKEQFARLETEIETMGVTVRRIDDYLRSNR